MERDVKRGCCSCTSYKLTMKQEPCKSCKDWSNWEDIALYATVRLGQVFPVVDLSKQAIETILGVNVLKVVENIFEHNNSPVFGTTNEPEKKIKRDC